MKFTLADIRLTPATPRQEAYLRAIGEWQDGTSFDEANKIISAHVASRDSIDRNGRTTEYRPRRTPVAGANIKPFTFEDDDEAELLP